MFALGSAIYEITAWMRPLDRHDFEEIVNNMLDNEELLGRRLSGCAGTRDARVCRR